MNCPQARHDVHAYMDGELAAAETLALEAHLLECSACRGEFEALLASVEAVRGAGAVYDAPQASREGVQRLVTHHHRRLRWWRAGAAASLVAILCGGYVLVNQRLESRDRFAAFAAESHLRYARGAMPLDIRSDQPAAVADWLSERLPFRLTLPKDPEPAGQAKEYVLAGARLQQYGEDDVAYLAYRMNGRPISLLIASSPRIVPRGGSVYQLGGLTFHSNSSKGLQTITWVDRGLIYALVSDLHSVGAESCVVCHGGVGEDRKFAPLRLKL